MYCTAVMYTVSVLGQEEGYMVKYTPSPEGVPEGEAQGNCRRRRNICDRTSRVESLYKQYIILTIIKLKFPH